jgi:hypothetical protein
MVEGAHLHYTTHEREVMPEAVKEAMLAYRDQSDYFSRFVEEKLQVQIGAFLPSEDLIRVAKLWGEANNQEAMKKSSAYNFAEMFKTCPGTERVEHGRKIMDGKKISGYKNIKLGPTTMNDKVKTTLADSLVYRG